MRVAAAGVPVKPSGRGGLAPGAPRSVRGATCSAARGIGGRPVCSLQRGRPRGGRDHRRAGSRRGRARPEGGEPRLDRSRGRPGRRSPPKRRRRGAPDGRSGNWDAGRGRVGALRSAAIAGWMVRAGAGGPHRGPRDGDPARSEATPLALDPSAVAQLGGSVAHPTESGTTTGQPLGWGCRVPVDWGRGRSGELGGGTVQDASDGAGAGGFCGAGWGSAALRSRPRLQV